MDSTIAKIKCYLEENSIIISIALISILLHFFVNLFTAYGIFRDELYYIACSKKLAFGYVDQPPLCALLLAFNGLLFGDSLFAIRLLPAFCHAGTILFTGLMTKSIGGNKFAILLASITVLFFPVYLSIFNIYSMNSFDILFWTTCFYVFVEIVKNGNNKLWILLGVLIGFGLQNKMSIMFFCFAIYAGILFTPLRKYYINKYFWIGNILAALIFIPNILWQVTNNWPTLEFMHNATVHKNAPIGFLDFLIGQIMMVSPTNLIIWLSGLIYLLISKELKQYKAMAIGYILLFILFVLQKGKPYYLSPYYPILIASGSFAIGKFISLKNINWLRPIVLSFIIIGGFVSLPMAMPILQPETYVKYSASLGITPGGDERDKPSKLGQHYADMFGWKEMADSVAKAYSSLTQIEKKDCIIFAQNYGDAGAIEYFGQKYKLPEVVSGHNNYWFWGPPKWNGNVLIIIGGSEADYKNNFREYRRAGTIDHPYARSFERHLPIWICKGMKLPIEKIWPKTKEFI